MFPMMFLSGTFFPLEQMPDFLQGTAKFLPLYYVNEGLRSSMITQEMGIIIESLVIILIVAIIIFIMGVFLTSWKDD
jgi:ABC-2 type transport system permease protein